MQVYATGAVTVTFDPNICVHSGACVRGLPQVFNVREKRWVRPERAPADAVIAQVQRCPSGALRAWRAGEDPSPGHDGAHAATAPDADDVPLEERGG
ncbi:MAG: (4Fe-4S)-binding protein [Gemmatimonadetes bacterium]|nr:(4Fe-4S)-binding protein [Gemmatimonadota bacterium]